MSDEKTYENWCCYADGICPVIYAYKYIEKETHNELIYIFVVYQKDMNLI